MINLCVCYNCTYVFIVAKMATSPFSCLGGVSLIEYSMYFSVMHARMPCCLQVHVPQRYFFMRDFRAIDLERTLLKDFLFILIYHGDELYSRNPDDPLNRW